MFSRKLILFLAGGFGLGKIPCAQGTFGSVLGVGWLALLMLSRSWWVFGVGVFAGLAASVWLCDRAEKLLNEKDPGFVVVDEVTAMPLCYAAWLALKYGEIPDPARCFSEHWGWIIVIFGLFRVFDIVKPWPVYQSQSLPGGWGVTVDDALAGVYVNVIVLIIAAIAPYLGR